MGSESWSMWAGAVGDAGRVGAFGTRCWWVVVVVVVVVAVEAAAAAGVELGSLAGWLAD